jgi:ligand-binding sensor domain-containing protein/signal transduction histidine kinase
MLSSRAHLSLMIPVPTHFFAALLCLLGLLSGGRALALDPDKAFEHYVSNSWSIQEGLPQISALAITQDRDGYIWVGTQNGLARFDGVRFTTYTPESEPELPGIYIRALLVDHDGRVWIGTYKGLALFERGHFRSITAADATHRPPLDINALVQTSDGNIVAATDQGVFRVDGTHLVELPKGPKPALSLMSHADGLWVGGNGTVVRMDHGQSFSMPLPPQQISAGITHLADAQGRIWAGTTQGLYSRVADAWVRFNEDPSLATSPVNSILRDHDDNLWISTNSGFARLRNAHLTERIDGTNLRATRGVVSSFEDREKNLWLGSQQEGLARVWNGWTRRYGVNDGLNDPIVWSLSRAPDGLVWVGTNNGLSTFDGKRFTLVVPGSALPHPHAYSLLAESGQVWIGTRRGLAIWRNGKVETPALYAPMASAQIQGIWRDRKGDLWFPTTEGLFFQHGQSLRRFGQQDGLGDPRARTLLETRTHRLLVGTQGGLYERHGDRFAAVTGLPPGLDVTTISELPSGELVIGVLAESIDVFDGRIWTNIGRAQGLPRTAPFFQTVDDRGYLWIAGIRGVERVQVEDLQRFAHGQASSVGGEMLLNERGDANAGQQGECCNGAGLSKGFIDGHVLWLPSRNGVVELDTHAIVKNTVTPSVVIERTRYLDTWHLVQKAETHVGPGPIEPEFFKSTPVELEPAARDLTFDFTAPSFQDPRSILMRYRLFGYDRAWHDLEDVTRRSVNYTNLPPGDYSFAVSATNNAGVWSPQTARFAFHIQPWFYETNLFYGLLALVLAALIYAGYLRQRQLHIAQRHLLEQQVHERTRDLTTTLDQLRAAQDELVRREKLASLGGLVAGIAHEINTPLGICVTATSFVQNQLCQWHAWQKAGTFDANRVEAMLDELDAAVRLLDSNTRRGADLVRSFKQVAVDQSSGQMRTFDLAEYLDEIVMSLKPVLARAPCAVQVECRSAIKMTSFPGALSQVVTNLIMNAVTHAFEGRSQGSIRVHASTDGQDVVLIVSDDGIGMADADLKRYFDPFFTTRRSSGGTGLGAHIVFNQVTNVLGGTIRVTSALGSGTQVQMRLPRTIEAPRGRTDG